MTTNNCAYCGHDLELHRLFRRGKGYGCLVSKCDCDLGKFEP